MLPLLLYLHLTFSCVLPFLSFLLQCLRFGFLWLLFFFLCLVFALVVLFCLLLVLALAFPLAFPLAFGLAFCLGPWACSFFLGYLSLLLAALFLASPGLSLPQLCLSVWRSWVRVWWSFLQQQVFFSPWLRKNKPEVNFRNLVKGIMVLMFLHCIMNACFSQLHFCF